MTPFFYIIPGINNPLENARNWDYQAQAWLRGNGRDRGVDVHAAGFNYSAGVMGGVTARDEFAKQVAFDLINAANEAMRPIVVFAHSNGCPIVLEALTDYPDAKVDVLHLAAAACDHDCEKNGLNLAVSRGQVGKVVLYVSPEDEVLGLPNIGYGDLGKVGPANESDQLAAIRRVITRKCKHSGVVGTHFNETMQCVADSAGRKA